MADTILNGKYTLLRELGRGTFGVVWLARHELLDGEERAIKILRRGVGGAGSTLYEQAKSRFEQEAQLGAQLNRTGSARTVRVFDFEREGDDLYLVMEYLPGGSLKDRLEKGPLPIADVIRIAREVAEGLAALHALDVVHRDIKPSNILFGADGAARLGDFGLAQTRRGMSLGTLGSDGAARGQPGTPDYMSPEQSRGEARLSKASDVYALGVVLFECLTGKLYADVKPGTDARSLRADCPAWLAQMIARILQAEAVKRPFDGRSFVDELKTRMPNAQPNRRMLVVGALLALSLGTIVAILAFSNASMSRALRNDVASGATPFATGVQQETSATSTAKGLTQSQITPEATVQQTRSTGTGTSEPTATSPSTATGTPTQAAPSATPSATPTSTSRPTLPPPTPRATSTPIPPTWTPAVEPAPRPMSILSPRDAKVDAIFTLTWVPYPGAAKYHVLCGKYSYGPSSNIIYDVFYDGKVDSTSVEVAANATSSGDGIYCNIYALDSLGNRLEMGAIGVNRR
jgi:serine/threonine-protein kinase